ncbi:ABC transporter permease, partial [Vibrio alfacsensis]
MGYFLRRLSLYAVALLVAATINFIIPRAMPGDPVTMMFAHTT